MDYHYHFTLVYVTLNENQKFINPYQYKNQAYSPTKKPQNPLTRKQSRISLTKSSYESYNTISLSFYPILVMNTYK